jgi:hypothetical protein
MLFEPLDRRLPTASLLTLTFSTTSCEYSAKPLAISAASCQLIR